jgi:peptide/nickel transport system substrate-binding protein
MMRRSCRIAVAATTALTLWLGGQGALAQKSGGILKMPDFASPASMSIHEEVTRAAVTVLMPVFNNLVLFDQHKERNTIDTIVPDLAESWAWSEDGKELTFKLRHGVKWHDGKPFTSADVKCTWDLLQGKTQEKLRINPRKAWYRNLDEVTTKGDDEVTFHLKRPQPYLLVLLASGVSPVYPCHVSPAQMRQHPIGTGPFKFVEYKPNEYVKLTRNPDYWRPGRPYLDGLEFPIVSSVATRNLMFIADNVDMTLSYGVSMPLLRDIKSQVSDATCTITTDNGARNLIINPAQPPFDNSELRRALSLTLDRKAFIDILVEGQGLIGGAMQPPPDGIWGLPAEKLAELPGYSSDVAKHRAEARAIMEKLGYGPNKRLAITVSTRNTAGYRDPAVIAIDQMKEIYIDGTLEPIETANWFPKVIRKDYTVGANISETGRRPRPDVLRELRLRFRSQLHGVLRQGSRRANRPTVGRAQRREAAAAGVGDRAPAGARRLAPDHLLYPCRDLLAAAREGSQPCRQQRLQQLALRGRMARQVEGCPSPSWNLSVQGDRFAWV